MFHRDEEKNSNNIDDRLKLLEEEYRASVEKKAIGVRSAETDTEIKSSAIKRDILEDQMVGNNDKETLALIFAIDPEKSEIDQQKEINALNIVSRGLFAKIQAENIPIDYFSNFENLKQIYANPELDENLTKKLNFCEKAALAKLIQISQTPSDLHNLYKQKWQKFLEAMEDNYKKSLAATAAIQQFTNPNSADAGSDEQKFANTKKSKDRRRKQRQQTEKGSEENEEGTTVNKYLKFAKSHPIITGAVLLAGAYGLYKLFSSDEKKPNSEKSSMFSGWFGKILGVSGILLGIHTAGALMPSLAGKFWDFIKGNIDESVSPEDTKNAKFLKKAIGKPIDDTTLKNLKDQKFNDFMGTWSQLKSYSFSGIASTIGIGDYAKDYNQQEDMQDYFKKNETRIKNLKLGKDATVADVIEALEQNKKTPSPQDQTQEKSSNTKVAMESENSSETIGGTAIAIGEGTTAEALIVDQDAIAEEGENIAGENTKRVLKELSEDPMSIVKQTNQSVEKLSTAVKEDGLTIATSGSTSMLWTGYKWIVLSSWEPLARTFVELATLDPAGAAKEYWEGTWKFILIGAGIGALKGGKHGRIVEALRYGKKGLFFPYTVAKLHVRGAQGATRLYKEGDFYVKRLISDADMTRRVLEEECRYYGNLAESYDKTLTSRFQNIMFDKERLTKLRNRYYKRFQESYSQLTGKKFQILKQNGKEVDLKDEAIDEMRKFLERSETAPIKAKTPEELLETLQSKPNINTYKATLEAEALILDPSNPLRKAKLDEAKAIGGYLNAKKLNTAGLSMENDINSLRILPSHTDKATKLEAIARELKSKETGIQARVTEEVNAIVKEAKRTNMALTHPDVTEKLKAIDSTYTIPLAKEKQALSERMLREFKALPKSAQTPHLRKAINASLNKSTLTKIVTSQTVKGRAKMMVLMASLMFVTDQVIHKDEPERELEEITKELGPNFGQLLADICPLLGTYSSFYAAFTGRELVTKSDVSSNWDRTSNVIWGCVSAAADAITVIGAIPSGGTSLAAKTLLNLGIRAKKGNKVAIKMIESWPKIAKIADRMGGWKNLLSKIGGFTKQEGKLVNGLRTIERAGMVAGTGMLVAGVSQSLYYGFVDSETELEIPPEISNA
ncbi:MAG: pre-toxin TG domain-containing protein [Candidatus Gracilibacteria bacterium]|jgi:hypothetical protein